MELRKSMLSVVAIAALSASFTGCNSGSNDVSTTGSNTTHYTTPKGTVTGLVQDTNGNPMSGVKVYLADQQAITNAGGLYTFANVPVTNTAATNGDNAATNLSQVLSVTIAAPTGYLGATVTVTPNAQIDNAEGATTTNGVETFVDGYLAQAGSAVLPHLGATVTGKLEFAGSQASIGSQEISLDFVGVSNVAGTGTGGTTAQPQNGVITTYATGSYKVTTDANGYFSFTNLPADSELRYVVPNYTVVGEEVAQGIATSGSFADALVASTDSETSVINVGDIQVNPVVNDDTVSPFVTKVNGQIGNAAARQMLEDNTRQTFVVNFSEPMDMINDTDITPSVIVKAGATLATMLDVTLDANSVVMSADKKSMTITTPSAFTDGTLLDINILVTDFKDTAGNFLNVSPGTLPNIGYDSMTTANQVLKLQLQIFNDLNTNAAAVTTVAQQTVDTNGATNDAATLQAKSVSFNDVKDSGTPDNTIAQMNAADDDDADATADVDARLTALGTAAWGAAVTVDVSTARLTFTPSGAAAYKFTITRNSVPLQALVAANITVQGGATIAAVTDDAANTATITPVTPSSVTPMELVFANTVARVGDIITITPMDDLGYAGTSTTITLVDNVEPTTALQRSYYAGAATAGSDNTAVVQAFGAGGELAGVTTAATVGTPYLGVNPGLLDNYNGTALVSATQAGDKTLQDELTSKNKVTTTAGVNYIVPAKNAYDTTAYAAWNTDTSLARTIGVAFTEDIDLNGTTPTFTGTTATLSGWVKNNDVILDDNGLAVNVDLVNTTASNVIKLANGDHGKVVGFAGIKDNANNIASAAANPNVVVEDEMPPMVEKAEYNGQDVVITFNEAVQLTNGVTSLSILRDGGVNGQTATYTTAAAASWTLSNSNKTLTIAASEFSVAVGAGMVLSTAAQWDLGTAAYAETAYGTGTYTHANLDFSAVGDRVTTSNAAGNTWDRYAVNAGAQAVTAPLFAIADTTPVFALTTTDPRWAYNATTHKVTMTFTTNQPIISLNDVNIATGSYVAAGYALAGGNFTGVAQTITDYMAIVTSGGTYLNDGAGGAEGASDTKFVDLDIDTNNDLDFSSAASTVAFTNSNRTVTITLDTTIAGTSLLPAQANVDAYFDSNAAGDVKTFKFIVAKGNSSDDSETNRRLEVIINNP